MDTISSEVAFVSAELSGNSCTTCSTVHSSQITEYTETVGAITDDDDDDIIVQRSSSDFFTLVSLHVCRCVCMYVCMYVRTCVCMDGVHTYIPTNICMYV